jgi:hypothetical protein
VRSIPLPIERKGRVAATPHWTRLLLLLPWEVAVVASQQEAAEHTSWATTLSRTKRLVDRYVQNKREQT